MKLYGGAELVVEKVAHYLQAKGHKVDIATLSTDLQQPAYKDLSFILPPQDKQISYRLRGGLASIQEIIKMQATLAKLCKPILNNYDVIHPHNFPAIWSIPNHRKIVWLCNELPDLWHNAKTGGITNKVFDIARKIDGKIASSKHPISIVADENCAKLFRNRYNIEPHILSYGIDGQFFAASPHNPPKTEFRIICSAMVSPSKNQMAILKAIKTMQPWIPNMKIVFSGYVEESHPYTQQVKNYIAANKINAVFIPQTGRKELREIFRSSSVAVFASKGQGSWLSPFEMLACGVPIIVSPQMTCSSLIKQQGIGTVSNWIATALYDIHNNYEKYQNQAQKGRKFVINNLTWNNYGKEIERLMINTCRN